MRNGGSVTVFGSLDERSGFTCVLFDVNNSTVLITGKENGVIADVGDNGRIDFYHSIY